MYTKTKVEDVQIKEQEEQSDLSDNIQKQTSSLKQLLRPMLYALALAGNYNFKDIYGLRENSRSKYVLSIVYRICYFIVLLIYLIKCSASYFYLPSLYFNFITLAIQWTVFLIVVSLYNFKATSSKFGNYEKVFQSWDEKILPQFRECGIQYPGAKIRKGIIAVLTIAGIIVIINGIVTGISVRVSGGLFYTAPFESSWVTLTIYFVLLTLASLVWTLPTAFVVIFSLSIKEAFAVLNDYQKKLLLQNKCRICEDFQKLRLLHLDLCKLVNDLDKDLCWFYGILFLFFTLLGVFTLYHIITGSINNPFELFILLFWLACGIIGIGVPATFAALVNEAVIQVVIIERVRRWTEKGKAHAPLDTIYYINVQNMTQENVAQLNLFLSKLTGTQVGFSVCGLLNITKEFILTIAGVFLTYSAVLYTL